MNLVQTFGASETRSLQSFIRKNEADKTSECVWESKASKQRLKRDLAGKIEILKSEIEDLKQMVISLQPLLSQRGRGKRVAFQGELR
jgi:hypothetical protein